jgi:hypothetical protein
MISKTEAASLRANLLSPWSSQFDLARDSHLLTEMSMHLDW